MTDKTPEPRWRRRKQARPQELVDAALTLFTEQGFAATKLSDIARTAGVSKGTIYLYFQSKEDLLKAAVQRSITPIFDFADQYEVEEMSAGLSNTDILRNIAEAWLEKFDENQVSGIPKLIVAESLNFPELGKFFVESIMARARDLFTRIIQRGIASGEFREVNVDVRVNLFMAPIIWSQVYDHSIRPYDAAPLDTQAYLQEHLDIFLGSLKA